MRAPIGSGSSPLVLDQSLHFYSPNGHLKVLFYTFVNKTIYIFITQVLSLPVALESVYKAPSVTLTYWCEQKRSTGLPLKEESKPPRDLKNQNLEKLCVGIFPSRNCPKRPKLSLRAPIGIFTLKYS